MAQYSKKKWQKQVFSLNKKTGARDKTPVNALFN